MSLIQTFDPIGVGARDLRECLLLQINPVRNTKAITGKGKISNGVKVRGQENSLASQIINNYLPYLEKKRFEFIAKKLKVPLGRIKEAIKEIASFEPKPGRSFNTEKAVRLIPDAILKRDNDKYEVVYNDWELPNMVGKHKSTVSRTVSNKYLQTPDGIFELRHFLNSGVKQENGESYSSKAIKSKIRDLIENEEKERPFTDQEIVASLKKDEISVARRTIAKYRHQLKILSSKSRRE